MLVCDSNLVIIYFIQSCTCRLSTGLMLVRFLFYQENGAEVVGVETEWEHTFIRNWLLNFDIERQEQLKQRKSDSIRSQIVTYIGLGVGKCLW